MSTTPNNFMNFINLNGDNNEKKSISHINPQTIISTSINTYDLELNNPSFFNNWDLEYNVFSDLALNNNNDFFNSFQQTIPFNNNNSSDFPNLNNSLNIMKKYNSEGKNIKDSFSNSLNPQKLSELEIGKNSAKTELNNFRNEKVQKNKIIIFSSKKVIRNTSQMKKKTKSFTFKTSNIYFSKNGYNIKRNSKRHQNCIQKIIRNFIQDILVCWINNGENEKMLKKLSGKKILFHFINYKGKKLFEIYGQESCNNNIINKAFGSMKIKLNFKFEEAFEAFCFKDNNNYILSKIENLESQYNQIGKKEIGKDFFDKLKSKEKYINEKINEENDINLFKESFNQIISELEIERFLIK